MPRATGIGTKSNPRAVEAIRLLAGLGRSKKWIASTGLASRLQVLKILRELGPLPGPPVTTTERESEPCCSATKTS